MPGGAYDGWSLQHGKDMVSTEHKPGLHIAWYNWGKNVGEGCKRLENYAPVERPDEEK